MVLLSCQGELRQPSGAHWVWIDGKEMDKTLLKGLQVLETLATSASPCALGELAARLKLHKSNVHRVLKTLESAGFVQQNEETGRYAVSVKLWQLGSLVMAHLDVRREALDQLEYLAKETSETVYLSILDGSEILHIHRIESAEPIQAVQPVGGRAPLHAVSTGKAILAFQSPDFIKQVADDMKRFTSKTVRNARELVAELEKIRSQGFAVNQGEWRDSVCGVAAPIFSGDGRVRASLGIGFPALRFSAKRVKALLPPLLKASSSVSMRLGYTAPAVQKNPLVP